MKSPIIIHPKIRFIFFACRVYDWFQGVRLRFFSLLCRVYDYLRGVRIFHTIGCTIFFKVLQGVGLFQWVYDFILAKSAGCTFIRGCTIIRDFIVLFDLTRAPFWCNSFTFYSQGGGAVWQIFFLLATFLTINSHSYTYPHKRP